MVIVVPEKDSDTPEMRKIAETATKLLASVQPKPGEVMQEVVSQLIYGNPPSEGLPDTRPRRQRFPPDS